jgi:excinuclease UvrABC ATPase subunit
MTMATRTSAQSPALPVADRHDLIRVHGARVTNLKDVSVEHPKHRLTVFTGVSGSGKSSLVFGTATDANAMLRVPTQVITRRFL